MRETLICPFCGGKIRNKTGENIFDCPLCSKKILSAQAAAIEKDATNILNYRQELEFAANNNRIDNIIKYAELIIDIVPSDYIALYLYSYAKKVQGDNTYLKEFLTGKYNQFVLEDAEVVFRHICMAFDPEYYQDVVKYLSQMPEEVSSGWQKAYDNINEEYIQKQKMQKMLEKQKMIDDYLNSQKDKELVSVNKPSEELNKSAKGIIIALSIIVGILTIVTVYLAIYRLGNSNGQAALFALMLSFDVVTILVLINIILRRKK